MSKQSSMVNRPDVSDYVLVGPVAGKVEYHADHRYPLCGTFVILTEDHTIGNLIKVELLKDVNVRFAGYRVPHPLERKVEVRVQTEEETTPVKAVELALRQLRHDLTLLRDEFEVSVQKFKSQNILQQEETEWGSAYDADVSSATLIM